MPLPIRRTVVIAVLSFCAASLFAQRTSFGEPFPLTGVRYGTSRGHLPLLISNGRDPVLFWSDDRSVRATRFEHGLPTVSTAVVQDDAYEADFDAVWTGSHFLVAGMTQDTAVQRIVARLVDAAGSPIGEQFTIVQGRSPRLAFNGEHVLLLYVPNGGIGVNAFLLERDGTPAEAAPRALDVTQNGRIALTSNGSTFAAAIPRDREPHIMLFDARGRVQSDRILGDYGPGLSIASDGRRYLVLAACTDRGLCGNVYARIIEPDGSMSAAVELDPPFPLDPSAVWSGQDWVISYVREETATSPPRLQLLHLDAAARNVTQRAQVDTGAASSLAVIDGELVAAWVGNDESRDTIYVDGVPASFTSTWQLLLTTTTSADSTLFVWQEVGNLRTTLHVGLRDRDGRWSERELLSVRKPECCYEERMVVQAASDGHEFVLVIQADGQLVVQRLDSFGTPIGDAIAITGTSVTDLVWNGDDYLLFVNDRRVRRLTSSGVLSEAVPLSPLAAQTAKYASDGAGNLYAAWIVFTNQDHYTAPTGIAAIRLGKDLQALDAAPTILAANDQIGYGSINLAWDGTQYVVAWATASGLTAAQVAPSGAATVRRLFGATGDFINVTRVGGGAAILFSGRLAFLRSDGTATAPIKITSNVEPGRIEALPNGDAVFLENVPIDGIQRVTMRVASATPLPPRPDAPTVSLQRITEALVLHWTVPAQPVNGYRIEYRAGEGPWVELDQSFGAERRSIAVPVTSRARYAYRVRAWNDAGLGEYSTPVLTNLPRRRAVR
jgi:hypothetical protein